MNVEEAVNAYGEAWITPDGAKRRELLEKVWADEGVFCDPVATVEGREQLDAHIAGFPTRWPGHTIALTTAIDAHDGYARFGWEIRTPDGGVLTEGVDFATFAPDGRISRIVGFFGPLAPAPAP